MNEQNLQHLFGLAPAEVARPQDPIRQSDLERAE
jgi:hypothetical protein